MDTIFTRLELMLTTLTVFGAAASSPVLASYRGLCAAVAAGDVVRAAACYAGIYGGLREAGASSLGEYLVDLVKYGESACKALVVGMADAVLDARRDIRILSKSRRLTARRSKPVGRAVGRFVWRRYQYASRMGYKTALDFDALRHFLPSRRGRLRQIPRLWTEDGVRPVTRRIPSGMSR